MNRALNDAVQQLLGELIDSGEELGLQVAAYVDGERAVDAWAGVADVTTERRVEGDTLFTSWSTTKGWAATCLHILADRGQVEYDAPVADYWPEFATSGKGMISVRHVLAHTAGLPALPDDVSPEMMCDWDRMCAVLAAMEPLWFPGTQSGYHAWTFGWLVGEIVRRVSGKPIGEFAQEELCRPLGITDFYMGIPAEVESRVATLVHGPAAVPASPVSKLSPRVTPAHVTHADVVNRSDFRRSCIPGGGGIMNARAIARHYAMLAERGTLDGVRILSPERIDHMRAQQVDAFDIVGLRRVRRGMGYQLGGSEADGGEIEIGPSSRAFGHSGLGGSIGFADPEQRLSFGLTKTLLVDQPDKKKLARYRVATLIREHLGRW